MKGQAARKNSIAREKMLSNGRKALVNQEWGLAFSQLSAADSEKQLDPEDLVSLAVAAHILGNDAVGLEVLARAHQGFLNQGETAPAVRCAFWLGFTLLLNGESAQAGGWLSRATRLLEGHEDCVERGYLLLPAGYRGVNGSDPAEGYAAFLQATRIGERFQDKDLTTLGLHGQGRALIRQGEIERGVTLLDEAMVAVTSGEVSPSVAGSVYCSVIEACSDIFDLRRAQEWTNALDRWCSTQPDQVPYRGHCMLRRSELLQIHGAWPEAMDEADRARERFSGSMQKRPAGVAFFRLGDLHRLRGEFAEAEEAYRKANHLGASSQPGPAQLRLIQGRIDAAQKTIRHLLTEACEINQRSSVLDSYVEIMLAAGNVAEAATAADELAKIAANVKAPLLQAISERSMGAVRLAEGDVDGALAILRKALNVFRELAAPYEQARVQFLIANACQKRNDCDTAEIELDAARRTFEQLGALPDLARVDAFIRASKSNGSGPLTRRESEVLKLVAAGMTNREIASKLFISEKTVARHLSNIFVKLDLSSRAAATAYAYKHDLL